MPCRVPAMSRPMPANAAVPSSVGAGSPGPMRPSGSQPRARAVGTSTTTCSSSMASTMAILAPSSRGRPSGVVPSRLSTPYWRSKPVPMPRLTMAVDMMARARMPGARKSTGSSIPAGLGSTSTREKKTSSSSGMPMLTQQLLALAQAERQLDAGLGHAAPSWPAGRARRSSAVAGAAGARGAGTATVRRPATAARAERRPSASAGRRLGEAQEHVLEALAAGPQVAEAAGRARPASAVSAATVAGVGAASTRYSPGDTSTTGAPTACAERRRRRGPAAAPKRISSRWPGGISSLGRAGGQHAPVVDDHHPVGQLSASSRSWVVSSTVTPVVAQLGDRPGGSAGGRSDRCRRWARRGTPPRVGRPGPGPATGAAARRPTARARSMRRRSASPTRSSSSSGSAGSS